MMGRGRSDTPLMQADIRDLSHPYWAMEARSGLDMAILMVDRHDKMRDK
jgi:hypothetical protein